MRILFLHGLESGPHGRKFQALTWMFSEVLAPDCSGVTDARQRLEIILRALDRNPVPFLVVGSSMGGLMAMLLLEARPDLVAGLVLCAPALHRPETPAIAPDRLPPTRVIHGSRDEVVPPQTSLIFGSRLQLVDDDHGLTGSLAAILTAVFELKLILMKSKANEPF